MQRSQLLLLLMAPERAGWAAWRVVEEVNVGVLRWRARAVVYEDEAIGAARLDIFDGFLRGRRRGVVHNSSNLFPHARAHALSAASVAVLRADAAVLARRHSGKNPENVTAVP